MKYEIDVRKDELCAARKDGHMMTCESSLDGRHLRFDGWEIDYEKPGYALWIHKNPHKSKSGKALDAVKYIHGEGTLYLRDKKKVLDIKFVHGDYSARLFTCFGINEVRYASPARYYPVAIPSASGQRLHLLWVYSDATVYLDDGTEKIAFPCYQALDEEIFYHPVHGFWVDDKASWAIAEYRNGTTGEHRSILFTEKIHNYDIFSSDLASYRMRQPMMQSYGFTIEPAYRDWLCDQLPF